MPGAATVATTQRVGGGGRGMGDLLAAVHPLGPSGLLLLGRAGGTICRFAGGGTACASSASAGAVPASAEGIGHLLPGSRSAGRGAAACRLCSGLGDIARPAAAPWPAARSGGTGWNADRALPAADVAARAPAPASLAAAGAMRAPAMTAPPTPVAAAPMATPVPTAPTAAPAIAPAPSCGAPDTGPWRCRGRRCRAPARRARPASRPARGRWKARQGEHGTQRTGPSRCRR